MSVIEDDQGRGAGPAAPLGPPRVGGHLDGRIDAVNPASGIPLQGGPRTPPPVPGPVGRPVPLQGSRPLGPPSGGVPRPLGAPSPPPAAPPRRLVHPVPVRREVPDGPSPSSLPAAVTRWVRGALSTAGTRCAEPAIRRTLLAAGALLQVFVLVSAAAWWFSGDEEARTVAGGATMSWVGIVHDVGAAGVRLRSAPTAVPETSRDTAARGSRLQVTCGQTGDVVSSGAVHTATWLKTSDGLFVSMLYVRVPDRTSIVSCADSRVDAPLLALTDPANPALPPPPSVQGGDGAAVAAGGRGVGVVPGAAPGRTATAAPARPGAAVAPAPGAAPAAAGPVAPAKAPATQTAPPNKPANGAPDPAPAPPTASGGSSGTAHHADQHDTASPDEVPVG